MQQEMLAYERLRWALALAACKTEGGQTFWQVGSKDFGSTWVKCFGNQLIVKEEKHTMEYILNTGFNVHLKFAIKCVSICALY